MHRAGDVTYFAYDMSIIKHKIILQLILELVAETNFFLEKHIDYQP